MTSERVDGVPRAGAAVQYATWRAWRGPCGAGR